MIARLLKKNIHLRFIGLFELTILFSSLMVSYIYVKKELNYDNFNINLQRIIRLSLQFNNNDVDARMYGFTKESLIISDLPEVEDVVLLSKIESGYIEHNTYKYFIDDAFFVSSNFFEIFSYNLLIGEKETIINAPNKAAISEKYAKEIFGNESPIGKSITLTNWGLEGKTIIITGLFENFPTNSHFNANLLIHRPETENNDRTYVYLFLNENTDFNLVKKKIDDKFANWNKESKMQVTPHLFPLKDIHLYSNFQKELKNNGNYIYI